MKRYILAEEYGSHLDAGTKARRDALEILLKNGFEILRPVSMLKSSSEYTREEQKRRNASSWMRKKIRALRRSMLSIKAMRGAFEKTQAGDEVFVQFPFCQFFCGRHFQTVVFKKILSKTKTRLGVIVHDLDCLRDDHPLRKKNDIDFCKMAFLVICHNSSMKNFLVQNGVSESKIRVINLFDYLTNFSSAQHEMQDGIAIAGNLQKSEFLAQIFKLGNEVKFNIYGADGGRFSHFENVFYGGAIAPDALVQKIKGGFGLCWDGTSLESCEGPFGQYQAFNSPHKISLYIVAGLPVICWKNAALCEFLETNNLGFGVSSLYEIPDALKKISAEKYSAMKKSLALWAEKLRKGQSLLSVLEEQKNQN